MNPAVLALIDQERCINRDCFKVAGLDLSDELILRAAMLGATAALAILDDAGRTQANLFALGLIEEWKAAK